LNNKFARRFVTGANVIIRFAHRYLHDKARTCETLTARIGALEQREMTMRKTVLTILGSALIAAATVQIAAAAQPNKVRKADRAPAPMSTQIRNANAYASPAYAAQPDWSSRYEAWSSRYEGGAVSAPAGR
jgi:hypothetical protein